MNRDRRQNPRPHLLLYMRSWWVGLFHSALYQPHRLQGTQQGSFVTWALLLPPQAIFPPFLVSWLHRETAVDSVLDASSPGEFSTKHGDLSHPTENAVFLDGSLFCMRRLGTGEVVAYFPFFCLVLFCASEIEQLKSRLLLKASALPTA